MDENWKKRRTRLGKFLDKHKLSQSWLQKETNLSKNTLTRLCTAEEKTSYKSKPYGSIQTLIELAIKKRVPGVKKSDLWGDM